MAVPVTAREVADRVTATLRYTRTHRALLDAAREHGINPTAARLLLAVADRDGRALRGQLAEDLGMPRAHATRTLRRLYRASLATARAVDGGPVRPGVNTIVELTPVGMAAAQAIQARIERDTG